MEKNRSMVVTYTLAHFIVDFACAFLLFRLVYGNGQWLICLLLYNFCAFALQMPLGLLADRWNKNAVCAAIGCGLIVLSYGFGDYLILVAVIAGIGNGLFHVGGGIDVLNISKEKPTLLGIFVAPGALGLYIGTILGKQGGFPILLVVLALMMAIVAILTTSYANFQSFRSNNVPVSFQMKTSSGTLLGISCLLMVVCLRSYLGMILNFPWKSNGIWGIVFVCSIVVGKMVGGFLAVKLGVFRTSAMSLGLAAVLFLFPNYPLLGVAAILLFNMTMPITLWAMAQLLPGCKGFSFGLLTFGLFLGFVPVYLDFNPLFATSFGFAITAIGSLVLLRVGLCKVVE